MSAKLGKGIGLLRDLIVERLPEGPPLYPSEDVTDQSIESRLAELIREQALHVTHQEVPHSIAIVIEEIERDGELVKIHASLIVERDSQKGIVIGQRRRDPQEDRHTRPRGDGAAARRERLPGPPGEGAAGMAARSEGPRATGVLGHLQRLGRRRLPTWTPIVRCLIRCLDLTSLGDGDDADAIVALCARAAEPVRGQLDLTVAAVCVWPRFVPLARESLAGSPVRIACATGGFPDRRMRRLRSGSIRSGRRSTPAPTRWTSS